MSDHAPVLFNVFEDWNKESVVPHISFVLFVINYWLLNARFYSYSVRLLWNVLEGIWPIRFKTWFECRWPIGGSQQFIPFFGTFCCCSFSSQLTVGYSVGAVGMGTSPDTSFSISSIFLEQNKPPHSFLDEFLEVFHSLSPFIVKVYCIKFLMQ